MSVYLRTSRPLITALFLYAFALGPPAKAQATAKTQKQHVRPAAAAADPTDSGDALESTERRSMERFLSLVEKNPRRGTPLDRVYGYHVERGTLDEFIKSYRDRLDKKPDDGAAWLILGLLEFQRGQDAAAVTALQNAETQRAADPLPSFYLGQALVLIGQPENAAEAFERALTRKPARTDLLDIFQALGRVYQRTQKTDQAMQVWTRLEALFPGDLRVQEQIAQTLAEENQPAAALPRFEALAKRATDPFRQVQLSIAAADLKVRLGRSQDALHEFEIMLAKLRPDSWLHREVRRKIEEVFLRNDDQAGLVAYYEQWTKKEPDDVEALVRLGRTLAGMGRAPEAHAWINKAVKLAPSRRDLRLALISQLAQDQKFAEAAEQYQALDQAEPNNPDTLRDWGALVLRDSSRPGPEKKAAAAAIWRKMLDAKPNDPVTTAQVADLLRQAELTEPALELYRKAAALAPTNPQYHEYIGEYLHNLKRPDEAKAEWAKIAEGANRNAKTLARLSEVLAGFGYVKEALPPLDEAIALEADSFDLRLKLASLDHRLEKFDDAETQLAAAAKLAEKDEEKAAVLDARVKNDQAANRLAGRIETLRKELEGNPKPTAGAWCVLARYLEADAKLPEAVRAADKALEIDPRSISAWTQAARLRESAGSLGDAAVALRRLAEIDRRNRTENLTGVARLEARLGQVEPALKAGRDLLAAAPGNPDSYEFFAHLCFGLGRPEEGLDALRRAVRLDPNNTKIALTLAGTLADQYRTDEAIEIYWRAFDKSEDLDGKIGTVSRLTELYLKRNQLDRLFSRLEHQEREAAAPGSAQAKSRDVAICMAQAYASSGDLGSARAELEKLLATDTRDVRLLQQLSRLAEEEGDLETAARYQKQQNDVAPSDDGASRLAQLFARSGELEEAEAQWSKMASGKSERFRIFGAIDSLLAQRKAGPVAEIADAMVRKDPHDWESLYRLGLSLFDERKPDLAAERFNALLELPGSDDELSALSRSRSKDPTLNAASTLPSALRQTTGPPIEQRLAQVAMIRRTTTLDGRVLLSNRALPTVWAPGDFGQARMASLAWLVAIAEKKGKAKGDEVIARFRKAAEKTPADPRALWDSFYLALLRYDNAATLAAGKLLSQRVPNDPLALWAYLYSLGGRERLAGQRIYVNGNLGQQAKDTTPPLPAAELDHVMVCYRALRARRPELAQTQVLHVVFTELKRAKRTDEENKLYRESIDRATQIAELAGVFALAAEKGDVDALLLLCDRYERLQSAHGQQYYYTGSFYFAGPGAAVSQCMTGRADSKAHSDVLKILDHQLAAGRRRLERQSPGSSRSRNAGMGTSVVRTSSGSLMRQMQFAFPSANEYLDDSGIQVLRTAFDLFKRDDLTSDLVNHFRRLVAEAKTPADSNYPRIALASLLWWDDDKEEAIAEITKVAETSKPESDLRLDLAELLEQEGDRAAALATTESVQPLDNTRMKRREELALRLAVLNGDLDRARQAAERLFGLRLDTDTQVRLAGQMHQLGLHELAEAVLGRARRRAGNQASALAGMMVQYQRQGQLDIAVQVAMQILRSTNAVRPTTAVNTRATGLVDANRTAAINVLARSGRLPQLIERATEQLKKTPRSIQLHQTLADYYQASNQREKATAELASVIALRPEDTNLRLQVAGKLLQENQAAAALEHYKVLLQKDPVVLSRYFYQVQNAFQQLGKTEELVTLLDQMDFRQLGQSGNVINMISNLSNEKAFKSRAAAFMKKVWDAFPDERSQILQMIPQVDLSQMPEIENYLREALIPDPATFQPLNQWNATFQILAYNGSGRTTSMASMILDNAAAQGQLEQVGDRIEVARKKMPEWVAGEILRALVDCRLGRIDQARRGLRPLLEKKPDANIQSNVYWIVGEELENHAATRDLAYTIYEAAVNRPDEDPFSRLQFNNGPAARLMSLYEQDHRIEDLRRLLLKSTKTDESAGINVGYSVDYLKQLKIQGLATAANKLLTLGFAADSVLLYNQAIGLSAQMAPDAPRYFVNGNGSPGFFNEGLTRALDAVTPTELAASLSRLLQAEDSPNLSDAKLKSSNSAAGPASSSVKPKKDEPFLDMMVLVHPHELDKARLRSLLAEAITAAPEGPSDAPGAENGQRKLTAALESARKKHPDDFGLAICEALRALSGNDRALLAPAVARLVELITKTPLETLEAGEHANARQRAQAARQIPLWLVARACWNQKDGKGDAKLAEMMAARALEAARRQTDNTFYLAMIREQGERALENGDRAAALAAWHRMLEIVVSSSQTKVKKPARTPAGGPATRPAPAKSAKPAATPSGAMLSVPRASLVRLASYQAQSQRPAGAIQKGKAATSRPGGANPATAGERTKEATAQPGAAGPARKAAGARRPTSGAARSNLPILTLDRFEQAMQIARLAAEHDLPELSLKAVHDSLRAGPPVVPNNNNAPMARAVRMGADEGAVDPASPRVVANLMQLDPIWQKHKFAPAAVYEALRDVVMPPARPTEMFLYTTPILANTLRTPQSVGTLLAAWAVRAGKSGDLRQAVAARQGHVMAQLPSLVLSAQLAAAANEPAASLEALRALAARMKNDTSRTTSELACHAAIPALEHRAPDVAKAAVLVLDACSKGLETTGQPEPVSSLLLLLARRQFQLDDQAGARKHLEAYLESAEKNTIRYGGDYVLYVRKQQLERVADEYARAGLWADAMASLGRFLDAPAYSGGDPPVDSTLTRALSRIEATPAKEQYQTLHAWTMPEKDRQAVRILTSHGSRQSVPPIFSRSGAGAPGEPGGNPAKKPESASDNRGSVSTARTLIEAARRAGTLDTLAAEARAAALLKTDKKIENAQTLHLLVELARGQGAAVVPDIDSRAAEIVRENNHAAQPGVTRTFTRSAAILRREAAATTEPLVFSETDFQLARAAVANSDDGVVHSGLRLLEALAERAKNRSRPGLARVRAELAEAVARKEGAPAVLEGANLAWWHPANAGFGFQTAGGWSPNFWTAQDGLVAHLAGSDVDLLLFDFPLAGTFEFSVDAYEGPWAESALTHNALLLEPASGQGNSQISQVGDFQQVPLGWNLNRKSGFNTMTVQVSPQKVRYVVNGHLFYEDDDPGPTAPWLGLFTHRDHHSVWRGFTLRGEPKIPRELKLCEGSRLDGWVSTFYNESQPARLTAGFANNQFGNRMGGQAAPGIPQNRRSASSPKKSEPVNPNAFDWTASNGVIHGRRVIPDSQRAMAMGDTAPSEADQSRLCYFRPLRDGDTLSYEFLFEPGQTMVHPALDRLVFLCEPAGVRLHWMTDSSDSSGLPADNTADEPENRRGPKALPLEPGKWNAIKLSIENSKATLELNGQAIYERLLEPGLSRQFSFFHFKDRTVAQARNVVLRGRWPQTLSAEQKANLISSDGAADSVAARRTRRALIDESFFALEAGRVLEATRAPAPKDRFERLAAWVLAAPDRPVWRLSGELSPSFPAPSIANEAGTTSADAARGATKPPGAERLETGGEITAPALELVAAAQAAGKLDELAERVRSVKAEGGAESSEFERGRLALTGIIQIARADDAGALKTMAALETPLKKLDPDTPVYSRWPELLLTSQAITRPALRHPAAKMREIMLEQTRTRTRTDGPFQIFNVVWEQLLSHEHARSHLLSLADQDKAQGRHSVGAGLGAPGWARVTHHRAESRGQGRPMAQWDTHDGELKHYPGHDLDMMYLNVPLRGDFQLDCELSSTVGRRIRVIYGGVGIAPLNDPKQLERFQLGGSTTELMLNPPLAKLGDWYPFRLVAKGGRVKAFVNGREVYDLAISPDGDPWPALLCQGTETGAARGIKITGNPQIPEKLRLSVLPELTGWLANEYGDVSTDDPEWDQRGEELTAKVHENIPGTKQENVLRYHRPMLEDGRIEYEFYFDPGKVMVHPAIDRLAFLIEPAGVKIHRLTDGAYERSGLAADNVCDEPENRRGTGPLPLKPHAWNHLALRLSGDKVTIELGGQPVFERRLEPENGRSFGLFHYADETQVRVRNVIYQGNWPKALPESVRQGDR
jgi:predicted Zn-dependent protease